jgi:hypothetical protein
MPLKSFTRKLRLLTIIFPLIALAGCWGNGSGPSSTNDAKAPPRPPPLEPVELLKNRDFDAGDASSGDNLGTPPDWSGSFNGTAVSSCLFDECQQVPVRGKRGRAGLVVARRQTIQATATIRQLAEDV